jgi:hypothetical protein
MASESPKWIALVLSILAIAISSLSWWEAHRNRIINEEINRPVLTISVDDVSDAYVHEPGLSFVYRATIKNEGKTVAKILSAEIAGTAHTVPDCDGKPSGEKYHQGLDEPPWILLPNETRSFFITLYFDCQADFRPAIQFEMKARYSFPGTGSEYSQTATTTTLPKPN